MRPTKLGLMRFGVLIITVLVAACTDNVPVDSGASSASPWFTDAAVFWPTSVDPLFPLVETFPFPSSDHRLVWVDVQVPDAK